MDVIPIRIRDRVAVQIGGLPADLTQREADKIIRMIEAHVMELDEHQQGNGGGES